MPFYRTPHAIKSWGKTSGAPSEEDAHASWSDLFFDLLFVAVAFSVGHLLEHSEVTISGVLVSLSIFWVLASVWLDKVIFFARFDVDDTAHKILDIAEYMIVGLMAFHISGLPCGHGHHDGHGDQSHDKQPHEDHHLGATTFGSEELNALGFAAAACSHTALLVGRYLEMAVLSSDPASAMVGKKSVEKKGLVLVVRLAAFAYLFQLSGNRGLALVLKVLAVLIFTNYMELLELVRAILFPRKQRQETASSSSNNNNNNKAQTAKKKDDHGGERGVPLHIGFVAHRFGEFMMLMIGEGVLSLATATNATPSLGRYLSVLAGFGITCAIMYCQYAASVFDVTHHAMRRSALGGIAWVQTSILHAFSLVVVGVALRMLLGHVSTLPPLATVDLFAAVLGVQLLCAQAVKRLHSGKWGSALVGFLEVGVGGGLVTALPVLVRSKVLLHTGQSILFYGAAVTFYQVMVEVGDPLSEGLGSRFHHHEHGHDDEHAHGHSKTE